MDFFSSFADIVKTIVEPVRNIMSSKEEAIVHSIAKRISESGSITIHGRPGEGLQAFKSREDAYEASCILAEAGIDPETGADVIAAAIRTACSASEIHFVNDCIGGLA